MNEWRRHYWWEYDDTERKVVRRVRLIPPKRKRAGYNCLELQRRADARRRDRAA